MTRVAASLVLLLLFPQIEPATQPAARRVQWLIFTQKSCLPCRRAEKDYRPWLVKAGWDVGPPGAQLRLVDCDLEPQMAQRFRVLQTPCFVLMIDGEEAERHTVYPGRDHLAERYIAAWTQIKKNHALGLP